jgi:hypothetical protein
VHLLTVHGVGRHDHLSNLLRTYQSLRANVTSVEAPVTFEDLIPGWRLARIEEGAAPPFLILEPRVAPQPGSVGAVHLYEVNYSSLAGVIRQNHPVDLTRLFLGLDLAVCAARQRAGAAGTSVLGGPTARLGACLQRLSGVMIAATVPIIGLPSIVFRDYLGTFISTFTRFFEDVSTFALDKNGEQLISAHLDRTIAAITALMRNGDRFVIAAHSLGSVVVHNYVVRSWAATAPGRVPDTLVTFGSPIGLLAWMWLYLDFQDIDIGQRIPGGDHYFCWDPVGHTAERRSPLTWINAVNAVDPIATSFPDAAADLSAPPETIAAALNGGAIQQRFFGQTRITRVGASHTEYLNDRNGFLQILVRAAGLDPSAPEAVPGTRTAAEHWEASRRVLLTLQIVLAVVGLAAISAYGGIVGFWLDDLRAVLFVAPFVWPALTVGILAQFQRLVLGGPNKRIPPALIRELRWRDLASLAYRLREAALRATGRSRDPDPLAPSAGYLPRLLVNVVSFVPALALMAIPVAGVSWLKGAWPAPGDLWTAAFGLGGLAALVAFTVYVVCCAAFELVRTWRTVIQVLEPPGGTPLTGSE